jgi:7-cyano-7-deazaguanine synthase in queuosine biosynthesis
VGGFGGGQDSTTCVRSVSESKESRDRVTDRRLEA